MEKLYFDIGAFCILLILVVSIFLRKMNEGKRNKWFIVIIMLYTTYSLNAF